MCCIKTRKYFSFLMLLRVFIPVYMLNFIKSLFILMKTLIGLLSFNLNSRTDFLRLNGAFILGINPPGSIYVNILNSLLNYLANV
jgi:hypothetical protein